MHFCMYTSLDLIDTYRCALYLCRTGLLSIRQMTQRYILMRNRDGPSKLTKTPPGICKLYYSPGF